MERVEAHYLRKYRDEINACLREREIHQSPNWVVIREVDAILIKIDKKIKELESNKDGSFTE